MWPPRTAPPNMQILDGIGVSVLKTKVSFKTTLSCKETPEAEETPQSFSTRVKRLGLDSSHGIILGE